jgi:hypothetical protein
VGVAGFRESAGAAATLLACAVLFASPQAASAAGPHIEESWAQGVTSTGASLFMRLDLHGQGVTFYFEFISDAAYRANSPGDRFTGAAKTTQGSITFNGVADVSRAISGGLVPSTVYHYRPVAIAAEGTTIGDEALEHVFVAEGEAAGSLPDGRAWEMVSPIDKNGGDIAAPGELFGGGDFQAGPPGTVTYGSGSSFGNAAGAPPSSQYLSRRGSSGWETENISAPLESAAYGDSPDGAPYRVFSADLSKGLLFGGLACRGGLAGCPAPNQPIPGSEAPPGYMAYYLRDVSSGHFASLLHAVDVAHSGVAPANFEVDVVAATPDLSHVLLSSCAALTAEATEVPAGSGRCDPAATNLYDSSAAGLRAVNLRPGEAITSPGATIAAALGAVSVDGSRTYWSTAGAIYLREGGATVWVDEGLGGGGEFQTATPDGGVAFLTKAGHLYRFTAATKALNDLTPTGGVVGVLGASNDGGSVYFQDGDGLELWRGGSTTTVAEGAEAALPSDYPPATATARVSADGLHMAFASKLPLTKFDNVDVNTRLPDVEIYVYGPPAGGGEAVLVCASCKRNGERPLGPASIPGVEANGSTGIYKPRVLTTDGLRLFFEREETEGEGLAGSRVFEWQAQGVGGCARPFGCTAAISGGRSPAASFVDASSDGTDVYFLTDKPLVKSDLGSIDLYDARVGGGFPSDERIICLADNCQPLPGEPDDPTPGTLVQNPGNPPLRVFAPKERKRHHHKKRRKHRHHRHRAAGARRDGRARLPIR